MISKTRFSVFFSHFLPRILWSTVKLRRNRVLETQCRCFWVKINNEKNRAADFGGPPDAQNCCRGGILLWSSVQNPYCVYEIAQSLVYLVVSFFFFKVFSLLTFLVCFWYIFHVAFWSFAAQFSFPFLSAEKLEYAAVFTMPAETSKSGGEFKICSQTVIIIIIIMIYTVRVGCTHTPSNDQRYTAQITDNR